MAAPILDHDTIVQAVRRWPRDAQLALAQEILRDALTPHEESSHAEPDRQAMPRARGSWRNLTGILATDQPPPSDEEIERWLEEHRLEKYGR